MSHAVNATLRDLVKHWRGDIGKLEFLQDGMQKYLISFSICLSNSYIRKIVFLLGSSCMEGYAAIGQLLLYDLKKAGVRIITSAEAFPELGDDNGDLDEVYIHLCRLPTLKI